MAPTEAQVQDQTQQIIFCLLDDDDGSAFRQGSSSDDGSIEPDGPDDFDPVLIADKLIQIADALNEDPKFKAACSELKSAVQQKAVETALGNCVEAVCQTQVRQAEVAPEMHLIRAAVAFAVYVKKSSPDLKDKVQNAMTSFLNRRVGSWVYKKGGWDKVVC